MKCIINKRHMKQSRKKFNINLDESQFFNNILKINLSWMKKSIIILLCQFTILTLTAQNHSLSFTSASIQNVVIKSAPVLGTNYTLEAFIYPQDNITAGLILGNLVNFSTFKLSPFMSNYQRNDIQYGISNGSNIRKIKWTCSVHNKMWNHVAITYNGSFISVYVNGELRDTLMTSLTPSADSVKFIGGNTRSTGTKEYFNGLIDEIRVWKVCRTHSEIQSKMTTNSLSGSEANLAMLYTFENNITDLTGKTTAKLNGATYVTNQFQLPVRSALNWVGNGTNGTFEISFTSSSTTKTPNYSPNHVLAIWVTKKTGEIVKTIKYYAGQRQTVLGHYDTTNGDWAPDAVSGASLKAFNTYAINWDAKDLFGNLIDDGVYNVNFELNDNNYPSRSSKFNIDIIKGISPVSLTPADDTSFSAISIKWNPIPSTINQTKLISDDVIVFPNPTNGILQIKLNKDFKANVQLKIMSVTGYIFLTEQFYKEEDTSILNYDISKFPDGNYILELVTNSIITRKEIILYNQ